MSNGPSIRYRWITKPYFRTCSTCLSRSQAPFCLYTRRRISKPAEGTFGRLRYALGGDRPSQTTHQALSLARLHGSRLGSNDNQGGIPRATPPRLAPQLQRLPPILYRLSLNPIPSCSKGAQGLSVLMRVTSIFTRITTSPGPLLRQCSDRYAIRAGRNLPDKEFRYLRTVIVTAAINRGFGSRLRLR